MHTPTISIQSQQTKFLQWHDRDGRQRQMTLAGDGQVEREAEFARDGFLRSLDDPRLVGGQADVGRLGGDWQYRYDRCLPNGAAVRLGSPDGPCQELTSQKLGAGLEQVTLQTHSAGIDHQLTGLFRDGQLDAGSVREEVVLDASAAGLPVYCDGALLFDLPSVYGGGCTI